MNSNNYEFEILMKRNDELKKVLSSEKLKSEMRKIKEISDKIILAYKNNKKLLFMGNGGSMGQAKHLAGELVGKFLKERKALNAISFDNEVIITAVANDYSYDSVFERFVDAYANKGDVVIGLTTSGNSKNIIKAFDLAKEKGAFTFSLTGRDGGKIVNHSDISIVIPSNSTPRIQEIHLLIGHTLCEIIEQRLF